MDYYRSAVDSVMGNTMENGRDLVSPSAAFEDDYVPFTTTPNNYGRHSSNSYAAHLNEFGENPSPYDRRPVTHSSDITNPDYVTRDVSGENRRVLSPMNHDDSPSSPLMPKAPPSSPVNPVFGLGQPSLPAPLPSIESRRPGRPRGGRLPAAEQYYRAVAQINHVPTRMLPGIAALNAPFAPHLGAPGLGQGPVQAFGQAGASLGITMDNGSYRGLGDGQAGDMAGRPAEPGHFPGHLGFGSQHPPGSAGSFAGFSSSAGGGHPAQFSSQAGGGQASQFAPPPPCQYGNNNNNGMNNNQFTAPPQFGGPSRFATPPQFTNLPPLHPSRQFAPSPTPYEQPQQRLTAPPPQLTLPPPLSIIHDLPASVTERPTFQRMLKQATDPEHLPPNITPEQAQLVQHTQIHAAKAKFDKVREANNKSAKRGRYRRMATTVALADEIMRQKAELARLREDNEEMQNKLDGVESVMPGLTNADEIVHGEQQGGAGAASVQHGTYGPGPTSSSSYFDDEDGSQSFEASSSSPVYESTHSNALGIMMPSMTDLFGSPVQQQTQQAGGGGEASQPNPFITSSTSHSNAFTLPPTSSATTTFSSSSSSTSSPPPSSSIQQQQQQPTSDDLALDRAFLREAHEMRLQLVDAVRGDKLHDLGFVCHDEIDAVVQRGRRIREMLGLPDDDWYKWTAAPAMLGRRKRALTAEDDEGGGEEGAKKKGKKVAGKA